MHVMHLPIIGNIFRCREVGQAWEPEVTPMQDHILGLYVVFEEGLVVVVAVVVMVAGVIDFFPWAGGTP